MPYTADVTDGVTPVADSLWEIVANIANYNVISGCGATFNAGAMTVIIAAGSTTFNGSTQAVAGNTPTLVSDPTNPRWTWIASSSTGVATVISGTPAATPAVPELGDYVALYLVKVEAGQTIANNITYKHDVRIFRPGGTPAVASVTGSATGLGSTTTSATYVDVTSGSITYTSTGKPAVVIAVVSAVANYFNQNGIADSTPTVAFSLDGAGEVGARQAQILSHYFSTAVATPVNGGNQTLVLVYVFSSVTAGSRTIKLRHKSDGVGANSATGAEAGVMYVFEI